MVPGPATGKRSFCCNQITFQDWATSWGKMIKDAKERCIEQLQLLGSFQRQRWLQAARWLGIQKHSTAQA
jgi:hypothetical protein